MEITRPLIDARTTDPTDPSPAHPPPPITHAASCTNVRLHIGAWGNGFLSCMYDSSSASRSAVRQSVEGSMERTCFRMASVVDVMSLAPTSCGWLRLRAAAAAAATRALQKRVCHSMRMPSITHSAWDRTRAGTTANCADANAQTRESSPTTYAQVESRRVASAGQDTWRTEEAG